MTIGELLSIARDLKGFSLRELENRSGVSNALISQIENGHVKEPGIFTVLRLCDSLGLSLDRISTVERPPINPTLSASRAKGGHARAEALSPDRRTEIARRAAETRWNKEPTDG